MSWVGWCLIALFLVWNLGIRKVAIGVDLGNFNNIPFMKLNIPNVWQFIYKINYIGYLYGIKNITNWNMINVTSIKYGYIIILK